MISNFSSRGTMSICQRVSLPSLCAATFHRNSLSVILHRFPATSFSSSRTMSSVSSVSPSQHITSGENTTSNPPPPAQNIISSSSSTPMYLSSHRSRRFALSPDFVKKYATKKPPFGYNGLGELVYRRTYSRKKEDGTNEQWFETVERVSVILDTFTWLAPFLVRFAFDVPSSLGLIHLISFLRCFLALACCLLLLGCEWYLQHAKALD